MEDYLFVIFLVVQLESRSVPLEYPDLFLLLTKTYILVVQWNIVVERTITKSKIPEKKNVIHLNTKAVIKTMLFTDNGTSLPFPIKLHIQY